MRAQSADEVAALRAELAALRANLEFLFDTDLSHRPAIETRSRRPRNAAGRARVRLGRIGSPSSRRHRRPCTDDDSRTAESPIIDVPAEPEPLARTAPPMLAGRPRPPEPHRRPTRGADQNASSRGARRPAVGAREPRLRYSLPPSTAADPDRQNRAAATAAAACRSCRRRRRTAAPASDAQRRRRHRGSGRLPPAAVAAGSAARAVDPAGRLVAPAERSGSSTSRAPAPATSSAGTRCSVRACRRGRPGATTDVADAGRHRPHSERRAGPASPRRRRDRGGAHTGGQSVAELLARLQRRFVGRRPSPSPRGVS